MEPQEGIRSGTTRRSQIKDPDGVGIPNQDTLRDNRGPQRRAQNRDNKGNQMGDPIRDHKKPLRPKKVPVISKDPHY